MSKSNEKQEPNQ